MDRSGEASSLMAASVARYVRGLADWRCATHRLRREGGEGIPAGICLPTRMRMTFACASQVARGVGDSDCGKLVSPEPDVSQHHLPDDTMLVIATVCVTRECNPQPAEQAVP